MPKCAKQDCCSSGSGDADLLQPAVTTMVTMNAQLIAKVAELQAEVVRLTTVQSLMDTQRTAELASMTGDGSGAGSPKAYEEMVGRNWHGRLGRTHMVDVDKLPDTARKELDCFLRRSINNIFPVGGAYKGIESDTVFAALSAFGLRLEDRGSLADVVPVADNTIKGSPTLTRMRNFSAWFYTYNGTFIHYWRASALETLIELARYRDLFGTDGFLKVVE